MTQEERAAAIQKISDLPGLAEQAIAGLTDDQLDTPYREGGWTLRQVIHHLADSHLHAYIRVRFVLTEQNPTLKPYDQDAWAALYDASAAPSAASLAILRGLHARWVQLMESLQEDAWSRTAFHPENGAMVLTDFLQIYSAHGEHHLAQILNLRKRMGW